MFTRLLICNHGISFPLLSATPVELVKADDLYPLVARMNNATERLLLLCCINGRKKLGCTPLSALTHIPMNDMVSGVTFSALSDTCWVMVIRNSKTSKKAPLIAKRMWNWVWGLKSVVCGESMYVLARLLIVQLDHTYANALSWSQSKERITASIRHTERLYTGPYNHSAELRASGKETVFSFSPHHHSKIREHQCIAALMLLNHFQKTFLTKHAPSAQWSDTAFW